MKIIIFVVAIVALALTQNIQLEEDFQRRIVYYGPSDHVCDKSYADQIKFTFRVNGIDRIKLQYWGATSCSPNHSRPQNFIVVPGGWAYYDPDQGNRIWFSQERQHFQWYDDIMAIIVKTKIDNKQPSILGGKEYKCKIIGDGQVQHYGVNIPNQTPSAILVACNDIQTNEQILKME